MDEEDLQLLKDVALIDKQLEIGSSNVLESISDLEPGNVVDSVTASDSAPRVAADPFSPVSVNESCQSMLRVIEKQILSLLEENRKEQEMLQMYLNKTEKIPEKVTRGNENPQLKHVGIPYFKDHQGYPQPRNDVVRERIMRGSLTCVDYLLKPCVWTKQGKERLKAAVLKDMKSSQSQVTDKTKDEENSNQAKDEQVVVHAKPIDWMKISTIDMNGRYSPSECEAKWNLHLSPDINKANWTKAETGKLESLAQKYDYQDWDTIAEKLGTKRSGLQCCIQYFAKNALSEGKWSEKEDAMLLELVEKHRKGNNISWMKIVWYFQSRSRKQCQERYTAHLRSDLKKGHFSEEEDKIIILGIKLFNDFGKIARFLPGRAATQIRSRFYHLIGTKMSEFSKEEDKLLISLTKQYSKEWLKISEHFENRSKLQCRKRYQAIRKQSDRSNPDFTIDSIVKHYRNTFPASEEKQGGKNTGRRGKKSATATAGRKRRASTTRKGLKIGTPAYQDIIDYFSACSENFFGPKVKKSPSESELKLLCTKMKATMAMLSVSWSNLSGKADLIRSLKDDCNFEPLDVNLLERLSQEEPSTADDSFTISGMPIPPNYATLTGLKTLTESRSRLRLRHREAEGLPAESGSSETIESRLPQSRAKELFQSRLRTLFLLPQFLRLVPTKDLTTAETFIRSKGKKPKTKTKRRLKAHAKFMSAIYQEKRRKQMTEASNTEEDNQNGVSETHQVDAREERMDAEPESEPEVPGKRPRRSLRTRRT